MTGGYSCSIIAIVIVVRAPLRISFAGGGTDFPDFYRRSPGRVISTAIDKYVYVVVNRTPLVNKVSARYSVSETVDHPRELRHTRVKAALLDVGIDKGIEIASFASLPAKTGLGSSSSFSVALLMALHAFQGKKIWKGELAEEASRLEIELLGEPIGKQDQYAAAFGGCNALQFNPDGSVDVRPVLLDYKKRAALEKHIVVFFTEITRPASSVLAQQKANIDKKFETLREMASAVPEFEQRLLAGDFRGLGEMLHDGWQRKKTLAPNVSNAVLDALYDAGVRAGSWGGKIIGAGAGGCIMFIASPDKKGALCSAVAEKAKELKLEGFREIPVALVQSGAEILYNGDRL